ncbi:uncharacterized protein BDR25DRAFT_291529 [Lindgomyces ingoldianus]|uniref:Uncharacterized protein n=1 Tax=Lindgomyces ingoldianus TaxID=673940 RepID=A0ACB6QNC5_9PLEO|nr:uncharacterized protein BDR25DRAFT_291529 [Lindgomyces ingoldianus]KAF2467615.1 hypothetical protein BDR25DRAFT_291529 [Lindgomyces ingoldianus]
MASWKVILDPTENRIEYTPFLKSRKFFAVDDSGSTAGSILKRERAFVEHLWNNFANQDNSISLWGSKCDEPTKKFGSVKWKSAHMGTYPTEILKNASALATIKKSDAWFLITDGEIYDGAVHQLAEMAHGSNILNVPIVFVIAGSRGRTPDTTNISVGISFFASAQDTLILFKETETGKLFVIAGKGCFSPLGGSSAAQDLTSWGDIPVFSGEDEFFSHCKKLDVQVVRTEFRKNLPKGVSLGQDWEKAHDGGPVMVDLDLLPQAGFLSDDDALNLFAEEAFNNLAVAYKTRKRIPELRSFVQAQKIEQVVPKLEDVSGAGVIISRMGDPATTQDERKALQGQLREAHAQNREHYQKVITEFTGSPKEQNIKKRNQLVDAALRSLASIEAASFSADILSRRSNRARRAEVVASDTSVAMANLDLSGPSFRGFCLVCCGEDEIMSICLKELSSVDADSNTTDFALNFPLAAGNTAKNVNSVSSQNICFQCALLGPSGMSIYKEKLKAIIPAVHYEGSNKKYINDQLYLALTAGLQTGAAGVAQLFMAVLEEILKTKPWAGAGLQDSQMSAGEQHEALQRRQTFRWMLDQVVQNTRTRQTFTEVGDWVKFPEALTWVAEDFKKNGLASFVITYPAVGYTNLLSLGHRTGAFPVEMVRLMSISKAVHSIASKYLADLQAAGSQTPDLQDEWKQKYMEVIYQEFNFTTVPKDIGGLQSLVVNADTFMGRLSACISLPDNPEGAPGPDRQVMMRKIQLVLFWLIYGQKSHCTAQTFFTKINHKEHLASAVLNPSLSVPESELHATLLSIFIRPGGELINPEAAALHASSIIPFKNPFGASVICCGADACRESFLPSHEHGNTAAVVEKIEEIRNNRTQHLIKVFGIRGRFENACTGLPEVTSAGSPPSSTHTNLHIAVVRTWAEQTPEKKRGIIHSKEDCEGFVKAVRKRICDQRRGDIFNGTIDDDVRAVLPSFFNVLGEALRLEGKGNEDISLYKHDFDQNKLDWKIGYELRASGLARA